MTEETMEEEISKKFEDYEERIIEEITKRLTYAWITEKIILVSWVWMLPINSEISRNIQLWSSLPIITVVWEQSWRFYFFSLKVLLPDVFNEIWKKKK